MLRDLNKIKGYVLLAEDGEIGRCKDFLFDDRHWTVRYMVADTGKWIPGRKVLISPVSLGRPEWDTKRLPVRLTKEKIEKSPPITADEPVSRQFEKEWHDHYGWAMYWTGDDLWGSVPFPADVYRISHQKITPKKTTEPVKSHLRSASEVEGYRIHASDGDVGHVDNFIMDDESWKIRYLVVDIQNWLPGRKVLVDPRWIKSVDWASSKVTLDVTRAKIEQSPRYDASAPVNRAYELQLYDYYGRPKYW
jgi:sporulation protein YlmC with PRC-barrel domain